MKKIATVFIILLVVIGVSASPVSISISPGAMINLQENYAHPDLTLANKATSVYAGATISLDVNVVAGFGLSLGIGIPYPVSIVVDGAKLDYGFNGVTMGMELSYKYDISEKWSIGAVAGLFQYAIPVNKSTTEVVGAKTIVTTWDKRLHMISLYGGLSGHYSFTEHWSVGASIKVGMLFDAGKINKTIKSTEGTTTTTDYDTDRIRQTGIMILPVLTVTYTF